MTRRLPCLYINVADTCNLRCAHCFNDGGRISGELLSDDEIVRLAIEARQSLETDCVQLSGGEPTLREGIIDLIDNLISHEMDIVLQTNGMLSPRVRDDLLDMGSRRLSLVVSMDGIETNDSLRGPGTTSGTFQNLESLAETFAIRINVLLSSLITWDEIERIAEAAEKLELSLAFNPVCPIGRADTDLLMPPHRYFQWMYKLEELRSRGITVRKCFDVQNGRLAETTPCHVRKSEAIQIAANGEAYVCGFLNTQRGRLGSVREAPIHELMRHYPADCQIPPAECARCPLFRKGRCFGGCLARVYAMYGTFDEIDPYCLARYNPENNG